MEYTVFLLQLYCITVCCCYVILSDESQNLGELH